MEFAIPKPEPVCLPVLDSEQVFPVNNIYCVGRNYAEHAVEMGHDPNREAPLFFMKPAFSLLPDGGNMRYPQWSQDVHHEVELVVALKKGGTNIPVNQAAQSVFGYAVGVDMTRRDLQAEAKKLGRPWEAAKTFLHAAPCSAISRTEDRILKEGNIQLFVNGVERQQGDINQMIWKIPEIINRMSELFVLQPGDLIFTGTPAGVGPVQRGDNLLALVENVGGLNISVVN